MNLLHVKLAAWSLKYVPDNLSCRTGVSYSTTNHAGVQVVRENSLMTPIDSDAHSTAYKSLQRRVTNSHADSILDLCSLQLSGDRMLLSASADGTVKAWK